MARGDSLSAKSRQLDAPIGIALSQNALGMSAAVCEWQYKSRKRDKPASALVSNNGSSQENHT